LAELSSCALMGTVVRAGSGTGVVIATGGDAEFGRIAVGLGEQQPETEFQVGLRKFSMLLVQVAGVFVVRPPAWVWLGLWFLYQLIEGSFGLFHAQANGGGVAFFAHVGGFVFGLVATRLLVRTGQATPQAGYAGSPL